MTFASLIRWLWPKAVPGQCQGCGGKCHLNTDMCDDCAWWWAIK